METKKHNIDILVAASNINILNALTQILPDIDDSRLWNVEYNLVTTDWHPMLDPATFKDENVLRGHICFEDITERDSIVVALRASQGLFNSCKAHSHIALTTNDHPLPEEERTGDIIEVKYGRDSSKKGSNSMGVYIENFDIDGVSQGREY